MSVQYPTTQGGYNAYYLAVFGKLPPMKQDQFDTTYTEDACTE